MELNSNRITAILGPTNTGKTYLAVETMLKFKSGILGFPLRLLAREIFDKCVAKIGPKKVALITGEEKILPNSAQYYICTVESMPQDISVDFVAIDEIQMCTDHERGHIFTDRLLNMRGSKLTMLLGSHTMKKIISLLVKNIEFIDRERYSKLTYSGYKKISRLNRKTAIIAFSIDEVYAIAELVRRQKGGSAIIMGSLSPKTRNAQVQLYQSNDVDFLVATDAIGMGINMEIDNVYFSSFKKFDGKKTRRLNLAEISQIAGRAGRYINDGNFGSTGQCENLSAEEIEYLENHKLKAIENIYWRNSDLNFSNSTGLIKSLEKKSESQLLRRIGECEDEKVLKYLLKNDSNIKVSNSTHYIKTLWECCQIPDFAKKTYGKHLEVVKKVFTFLISKKNKVPNSFMKEQLKELDKYQGNIDTLSNRISNIRTWSYVANKKNWAENRDYWIERTKNIEDKLSDKLHEELSRSFIDKRISILSRSLKQDIALSTKITDKSEVIIDDQFIGKLEGLKLKLDFKSESLDTDKKSLRRAARQAVAPELTKRVGKILKCEVLKLNYDQKIYWMDNPIAYLVPGRDYLHPNLKLIVDDAIDLDSKDKLKIFLENWINVYIKDELLDLLNLDNIEHKNGNIRALCFQLYENNGVLKRDAVYDMTKKLLKEDRTYLRKMGIKLGRYHLFLPKMLKPSAVTLRTNLWRNHFSNSEKIEPPKFGLNFFRNENKNLKKFFMICGFENFEYFYVRVDILERLFLKIIESTKKGKFKLDSNMINLIGCNRENFINLLNIMNYKYEKIKKNNEEYFTYKPKKYHKIKTKTSSKIIKNNPFNVLSNVSFE